MKRISKRKATVVALGIVSLTLSLSTAKAWSQEEICYDLGNPGAPPWSCEATPPDRVLVPVPRALTPEQTAPLIVQEDTTEPTIAEAKVVKPGPQRATHSPTKAKPVSTTVHEWTYEERFAFVEAYVAPLFASMARP